VRIASGRLSVNGENEKMAMAWRVASCGGEMAARRRVYASAMQMGDLGWKGGVVSGGEMAACLKWNGGSRGGESGRGGANGMADEIR